MRSIKTQCLIGAVAIGVSFGSTVIRADDKDPNQSTGQKETETQVGSSDQQFIQEASKGGMKEVELGKLAVRKAQGSDVKQLGQKIVDDHTKANKELKQICQKKGLSEEKSDAKSDPAVQHLETLSGAEFDRAFVQHMLEDHQKDIPKFEEQSTSAQDQEIKQFAEKTMPALREHLRMAQSLASKYGISEAAGAQKKKGKDWDENDPSKDKDKPEEKN